MPWIKALTGCLAPVFIVISPILSYGDQIYAMHRAKSSAGFSLDIPLIMLVSSMMRIFYYPGARFDLALLIQSFSTIIMHLILLKTGLDHRAPPPSKGGELPFARARGSIWDMKRPYSFWQWRSPKPYWHFLLYLFIGLTTFELILGPVDSIYPIYSQAVGYMGLLVEATLPLPQIFANARMRSCKGFRVSVVAFWLLGDAMKMFWFFTSPSEIPWAFKLCGVFQAGCDAFLGLQYVMYGSGDAAPKPPAPKMASRPAGHRSPVASRTPSGLGLANGRRTPITTEKKF